MPDIPDPQPLLESPSAARASAGDPVGSVVPPAPIVRTRAAELRSAAPRLLFESVLIMLSVVMGFAVNSYVERQKDITSAVDVVESFRREIAQNLRDLQDSHERGKYFLARLSDVDAQRTSNGSAMSVIAAAFPKGGLKLPKLSDAAWQAAMATDKVRLVDYRTAALLSETYLIQRESVMGTSNLFQSRLFERGTFGPADAAATLQMFAALTEQLLAQEEMLIDSYSTVLRKLPPPRATP